MKTIHWVTYLLMAATLFMVGCDLFAPKQQADFFECPPNNHDPDRLRACGVR
jgi:hypothetical protein